MKRHSPLALSLAAGLAGQGTEAVALRLLSAGAVEFEFDLAPTLAAGQRDGGRTGICLPSGHP